MEFISAEEFLEQPEEVQEIFLSWFNENVWAHDLVQEEDIIMLYKDYVEERICVEYDSYPLFTEGQLRKFIEDKTGFKVDLAWYTHSGYDLELYNTSTKRAKSERIFENLGHDLLQAYWKVACEIAKEEIKSE